MGIGGISISQLAVLLLFGLVFVLPFWQIFKKAGFSPLLSLLMFIPVINFFMLYYLAFATWHRPNGPGS